MHAPPDPLVILSHYPADCRPIAIEPLMNAGGFSGALLWRVTAPRGTLVLRRWPQAHPDRQRLQWIHGLLDDAQRQGFSRVPVPLVDRAQQTIVERDEWRWELAHWLPGVADYPSDPQPEKLAAAARALAQFHQATQDCSSARDARDGSPVTHAAAPAVRQRLTAFQTLARGQMSALIAAVHQPQADWPELRTFGQQHLERVVTHADFAARQLQSLADRPFGLQPCIRDIWHEHVLFEGPCVSGLIDFGSARMDTVTTDLARLLGSFAGNDAVAWSHGLAAYQMVRPLSADERALIAALDRANILLSGIHWLQWIFVERRLFGDTAAVMQRFAAIAARWPSLEKIK